MDAIAEWHGFFGALAGVGATLVGLVFVAITIHLGRRRPDPRTRLLASMSGVNLLHPTVAALIMLMPVSPRVQGVALVPLALLSVGATFLIARAEAREPAGQVRQMILYRYFLPLLAAGALAAGAVGLILEEMWGVYALPVFALLMIGVGTDNAWDLLFGDFGKRSFISLPPGATPPG